VAQCEDSYITISETTLLNETAQKIDSVQEDYLKNWTCSQIKESVNGD
jgi:hypothetical protein